MLPTNTVDAASFWLLPPLPSLMLTYLYTYFSHTIRRAHARSSRAGRFLKKRLRQSPSRLDVVRPPPLLLLRLVPIPSPSTDRHSPVEPRQLGYAVEACIFASTRNVTHPRSFLPSVSCREYVIAAPPPPAAAWLGYTVVRTDTKSVRGCILTMQGCCCRSPSVCGNGHRPY